MSGAEIHALLLSADHSRGHDVCELLHLDERAREASTTSSSPPPRVGRPRAPVTGVRAAERPRGDRGGAARAAAPHQPRHDAGQEAALVG